MEICPSECGIVCWAYQFQTLLAGLLAILAAIITAWALNKPIRVERENAARDAKNRLLVEGAELARDFQIISTRARQARGTIISVRAANAEVTEFEKAKMRIKLPRASNDHEFMALLGQELVQDFIGVSTEIINHNFDVDRASGSFGDDNFSAQMIRRTETIEALSEVFSAKINDLGQNAIT